MAYLELPINITGGLWEDAKIAGGSPGESSGRMWKIHTEWLQPVR